MRRGKILWILIILFALALTFFLDWKNGVMAKTKEELTTLTGTFRMVGNAPLQEVIFTTDDHKDFSVIGLSKEVMAGLQGKKIILEGYIKNKAGRYTKKAIKAVKLTVLDLDSN